MPWLKPVKKVKFLLFPVFIYGMFCLFPRHTFGQRSSVLASGSWLKLGVQQSGIYKIDAPLLKEMGIDISSITPAQIKIYGNGGAMLPQKLGVNRKEDLVENSILVRGEEDGRFDAGDVIYFYAEGPHQITWDSIQTSFAHQVNYYADTSYYFLNIGGVNGLRVNNKVSLTPSETVVNQFDDYWFHEQESVNLLRSGRDWWGEYIGNTGVFNVQAEIPDVVPYSSIIMRASAIGSAQISTSFQWQLNGQQAGNASIGVVGAGQYDLKARKSESRFVLNAIPNPPAVYTMGVSYNKNGQSSAQAYLDYVGLQTKRILKAFDKQQIYRFAPGTTDNATFQIKNVPADWLFWNISDPVGITSASLQNTGNNTYSFTDNHGKSLREYIGFTPAQAIIPVSWQKVANQNLRISTAPDLLIITVNAYEAEAKRLATFREEHDNLETLTVTVNQIYNEFSGGKPDVSAVRDFVRLLNQNDPGKLKYLLLFGDATYDYKNILQNQTLTQRNNWVPVYESRESLDPVYTYSSDDYFGFLENGEGEWIEKISGDYSMEIGVGRLPVKSVSDARTVVDKLIHYASSPKSRGGWQNTINFVADDGDGTIHQEHADALAKLTQTEFISNRIFMDAFQQTTTNLGQKAPAVNAAIKKSINDGTLILNYTGHGGTSGWAEEQILTLTEMQTARGYNNLPLLITATCDFGRYDDPGVMSGAELMVLSPRGAAIGAVSTTRPVYSSTNFTINKAFYEALIQLGNDAKLGDIFRQTKNKSLAGSLNRNFALLGDPSMRLARPEKKVIWREIPDTLRALQKVNLRGEIVDEGKADRGFQGTGRITIYDKQSTFRTLGNEGEAKSYNEFRNKLFEGTVQVKDGQFTCTFVMPKDIDYRTGLGRASIYVLSQDSLSDASGQLDILVGGSIAPEEDNIAPKITAYLNTEDFRDGDKVDGSSVLFLNLSDENGINVSKAGIGHDITVTLNDTLTIILNDFYTAGTDYRKGVVRYPFDNLPTGNYVVRIKVWDTYTNSSEISFGFQVGLPSGIKLSNLTVFPNPFDQDLSFEVNHNRADDDVEIVFSILLSSGQRLGSFQWQYYNSQSIIKETISSNRLSGFTSGVNMYIYVMKIRSLKDNSVDTRSGKLLRLR
jgi:hypothetical protein